MNFFACVQRGMKGSLPVCVQRGRGLGHALYGPRSRGDARGAWPLPRRQRPGASAWGRPRIGPAIACPSPLPSDHTSAHARKHRRRGAPTGAPPCPLQGGGGASGRRPHSRSPLHLRGSAVMKPPPSRRRGLNPRAWAGERRYRRYPAATAYDRSVVGVAAAYDRNTLREEQRP